MGISLWPVGPSKMLRCQNFDFDPIFWMPHQKFVKVHHSPLQPQKWVLDAFSQKIDLSNFKYNKMHTDMMPFDKKWENFQKWTKWPKLGPKKSKKYHKRAENLSKNYFAQKIHCNQLSGISIEKQSFYRSFKPKHPNFNFCIFIRTKFISCPICH